MNRDDIIRMALEANFRRDNKGLYGTHESDITPLLERFAALVAAHEREACAELCLETEPYYGVTFSRAIRARGEA